MIDEKGLCQIPVSSARLELEELGAGLAGLSPGLSKKVEAVDSSGEVGLFHLSSNLCPRPCS
jgi:hypothetical protein